MKPMTATEVLKRQKDGPRISPKNAKQYKKCLNELFQPMIDYATKYMVTHDMVKIGPKDKKLLKSSKVRAYFKEINKVMNSPEQKEKMYEKLYNDYFIEPEEDHRVVMSRRNYQRRFGLCLRDRNDHRTRRSRSA